MIATLLPLAFALAAHDYGIHALNLPAYCVTPEGPSPLPQTPLILSKCRDEEAQAWRCDRGRLTTMGQCLDVSADAESGAQVVLGDCDAGDVAQWDVEGHKLELANTSLCLEASFGLPEGAKLKVRECGLGLEQSWDVRAAADTQRASGPLTLQQAIGACAMVQPGSVVNGTPIVLGPCDAATPAAQQWVYAAGALMVLGRCATAASPSVGAPVVLSDCVAQAAQSWNAAAGHLQLANRTLCLDALQTDPQRGEQLVVTPCEQTASQRWAVLGDDTGW